MPPLSPVMEKFILHWGEMGTRWGINRTVAQIHALLFITGKPLNAEEIADTLSVARSNVSSSLRELQNWGLVKVVHVMGDRRDHFETFKDVWEMFRIIVEERKRREVDPTIEVLRECVRMAERDPRADKEQKRALKAMLDFFETANRGYEEYRKLPAGALGQIVKMGSKIRRFVGFA
jgi:DNA-binding transcriptional regulator GbsR (MarR family)